MKSSCYLTTLFILIASHLAFAQLSQTVRGTLVDQDVQTPLIGATVQVIGSDPLIGNITDLNGEFRLENVPVGRISLLITYVGYEPRTIPNVLVTSAKEVVMNITMQESIEKLDEIVVTAQKDKREVLNEMATVSARTFSVEETQRYAGSLSDPARMVSAFAGVTGNAEGDNDIVVRGNSSRGILWKLEGVEIPNPNHFANDGATGGPVSALNSNMLANSDFYSGAFAPEYGNALSGVFDMRFKNGNNERREYSASVSLLGIDFSAEGPFSPNYNGSFLANYRYSSLALLDVLGILDFGGVPKYQDASFKVDLPVSKKHRLSAFGLGGISSIGQEGEDDDGERLWRARMDADLGVIGLNHVFLISNQAFLKNFVSYSATHLNLKEEIPEGAEDYFTDIDSKVNKGFLRIGSTYNYKFNARHKLETGMIFSRYSFDAFAQERNYERDQLETVLDDRGHAQGLQAFTSWKYRIGEKWTMTSGLHYMYFGLTDFHSVEPRLGMRYDLNEKNAFTLGAGIHSRLETISIYKSQLTDASGNVTRPNEDLKPTKAAHFVFGYDRMLSAQTHLKVEAYYQHLYDVPVEPNQGSTYSLLNETDDFVTAELVNEGKGRNYGLEFTLERFFHNGLYYMSTLSLYESWYTPADGQERKTAFDGNYVFNLLGGKEWNVGSGAKSKVLFVNGKVSFIGGSRYTPIDLEASRELGTEVRTDDRPFSAKGDDIFVLNLSVGTRRNKGNTTREFKLDVRNVTNAQGTVNEYYEPATEKIEKSYQLSLIPNIVYSLKF